MPPLLKLHVWKLTGLLLAANFGLLAYLGTGTLKALSEWNWTDIGGEGGSALLVLVWIGLLLKSRPAGQVTTLLFYGLACLFFSLWMDTLDEFVQLPETIAWDKWLESGPMPVGFILMTLGIYHWHREQLAISGQMEKRERLFREPRRHPDAHAAERARRAAHHRRGTPGIDCTTRARTVCRVRPRAPVEGVLQQGRDRSVVLGIHHQQAIAGMQDLLQAHDAIGQARLDLEVAVVERRGIIGELDQVDLATGGLQRLRAGRGHAPGVGFAPAAAGHHDDSGGLHQRVSLSVRSAIRPQAAAVSPLPRE